MLSSLVLLNIYWTHKWYIYVLSKIDQLNFSAGPPLFPVPCNHSLTGSKLGRTNATHLQSMSWGSPNNVVHLGHPFETPRYTEVTLWWRGCVKPVHHTMFLVWVGEMYREVFWAITEIQNEKEPQHNLCAAPNFHLGGGSYCDSAYPSTLYEHFTLYDFLILPCF